MNNDVPDRVTNKDLYKFMLDSQQARHDMESNIVGKIDNLRTEFNNYKVVVGERCATLETDVDNLKKRDYPAYIGAIIAGILGAVGIVQK